MAPGAYKHAVGAARAYAREYGIVSDRFGHLYAVSAAVHEQLREVVRGQGRLRPDSTAPNPELALLTAGKEPRYARILRGWEELAERLIEHDLIRHCSDNKWRLTPEQLLKP